MSDNDNSTNTGGTDASDRSNDDLTNASSSDNSDNSSIMLFSNESLFPIGSDIDDDEDEDSYDDGSICCVVDSINFPGE
jgi:hypothetical protein